MKNIKIQEINDALSSSDVVQLQAEDDTATVLLNGEAVAIEQADDSCDPGDLCFDTGRQDLTITDDVGTVSVGEIATLSAEVVASGTSTDNITFGVLGTNELLDTGEKEILAVVKMDRLGSGTINISTEVPSFASGDDLFFQIRPVFTVEQAISGFNPSPENSESVKVGSVTGNNLLNLTIDGIPDLTIDGIEVNQAIQPFSLVDNVPLTTQPTAVPVPTYALVCSSVVGVLLFGALGIKAVKKGQRKM